MYIWYFFPYILYFCYKTWIFFVYFSHFPNRVPSSHMTTMQSFIWVNIKLFCNSLPPKTEIQLCILIILMKEFLQKKPVLCTPYFVKRYECACTSSLVKREKPNLLIIVLYLIWKFLVLVLTAIGRMTWKKKSRDHTVCSLSHYYSWSFIWINFHIL